MDITWNHVSKWLNTKIPDSLLPLKAPTNTTICTDSRKMKSGSWYLPLRGLKFDGHDFIGAVMKAGASGFFYDDERKVPSFALPKGVKVINVLSAYQDYAAGYRSLLDIPIAAITGSNGKTTVKEMLATILAEVGPAVVTKGNDNNEIGVPKTLLSMDNSAKWGVLEFGARHQGDIGLLTKIASPTLSCLLNVGQAHVGEFGSFENLLATKLEIFDLPKPYDTLVTCADDQRLLTAAEQKSDRIISFGFSPIASIRISDLKLAKNITSFSLTFPNESKVKIQKAFLHKTAPINMAAAAAISWAMGMLPEQIKAGLMKFSGVPGRFAIHKLGKLTVVDDCYNANPQSMKAGLESIGELFPNDKKLIVLGDMLELGSTSKKAHRDLANDVIPLQPHAVITIGKESMVTHKQLARQGLSAASNLHFRAANDAISKIDTLLSDINIVYLKGSNSIHLGRILDHIIETRS